MADLTSWAPSESSGSMDMSRHLGPLQEKRDAQLRECNVRWARQQVAFGFGYGSSDHGREVADIHQRYTEGVAKAVHDERLASYRMIAGMSQAGRETR